MVHRVHAKGSPIEPSLLHLSLIKLLVVTELQKKEFDNQWTKKNTPLVTFKEASPATANLVKNPLTKRKLVHKTSAKRMHLSPKVEKVARGPRIRVLAKIFPIDSSPVQVGEISKIAHGEMEVDERDQKIKDP